MILDNEEQRKLILYLVTMSTYKGTAIDEMYHFKKAIENAAVSKNDNVNKTSPVDRKK